MSFKSNISALLIVASATIALTVNPASAQENKPLTLADNAPDRYVVVPGDTLWGISAKFLKEPWRWPEIWGMNKDDIRNPQLIYPGAVLMLDRSGATPMLRMTSGAGETVKLSPKMYEEATQLAIASIPRREIEPYLSQPLFVEEGGFADSARIVATQESRVYVGQGGDAYISGGKTTEENSLWQIYRPAKLIKDPKTLEPLGYEAKYLGTARVLLPGNPAKISILTAKEEITPGDRLLPAAAPVSINYVPHAPLKTISDGRIAALYDGISTGETGRASIVLLNRGARDGLDIGAVLAIRRNGATVKDPEDPRKEIKLPNERYGSVFVFRVFEKVSYALIGAVTRPVAVADVLESP